MTEASSGPVRGRRKRLQVTTSAAALVLGLSACTTSGDGDLQSGAASDSQPPGLLGALQHVRENPADRLPTVAYCNLTVSRRDGDVPMDAFLSGVFDVPGDKSLRVFCAALVEAVIANELTDDELTVFSRPRSERGLEPLGVLLRKLIVAHERLKNQQVKGPEASGPAVAPS